jgi:flagellar protein FlaI
VRRSNAISEIGGIDQRTGELDYSNAFTWDADTDTFDRENSSLLDEIQDDRGWSRTRLLEELRDRRRFLTALRDQGITDYRQFTALVNEYYADSDRVLERVDRLVDEGPGA